MNELDYNSGMICLASIDKWASIDLATNPKKCNDKGSFSIILYIIYNVIYSIDFIFKLEIINLPKIAFLNYFKILIS